MNPMPRRKYIVVFGMALFFVSLWSMWSIINVQELSTVGRSSELIDLQSQIQNIEQHLEENKLAMIKLRNGFQDLLKLSQVADLKDDQQKKLVEQIVNQHQQSYNEMKIPVPKQNFTRYHDDGIQCQLLQHNREHLDVCMSNVYERLPFDDPDGGVWKQGFPIETNNNEWNGRKLRVFVVPHSHNDPGWIKTYEKYFMDQTRHILDSVVDGLSADSRRRFIWAEISYLSKWWDITDEARKTKARSLIANGQLEIVTGGWVMTDEANAHVYAMIDQMIEGHEWLNRVLGVKPRSGWAIDPFGHTPTMAYLLKKMGLDYMLIQRVHYSIKKHFAQTKSLEFRWRQDWEKDVDRDIVCHLMPFYSYDVPHTCGPDPKICCQFDFARLPGTKMNCPWKIPPKPITDQNVRERSETLLDQYRKKSKLFKTDVLLVILGDDFRYMTSKEVEAQFTNYRKIFDHVNSRSELNADLRFGTLTEYFDAMNKETGDGKQLPSLSGDFFTYNDRTDNFWSGYYTSRPYYKQQDRKLEGHLRAAEIAFSLAASKARVSKSIKKYSLGELFQKLTMARQNLGLFQHHDGITGTSKDAVVIDYGNKLRDSIMDTKEIIAKSTRFLLTNDPKGSFYTFNFDALMDAHDAIETKNLIKLDSTGSTVTNLVVYNSLSYERAGLVRLHIDCTEASVHTTTGEIVQSQLNLIWSRNAESLPDRYELVFIAKVPASGIMTYKLTCPTLSTFNTPSNVVIHNAPVTETHSESRGQFLVSMKARLDHDDGELTIENEHLLLHFHSASGLLHSITTKRNSKTSKVSVDFGVYSAKVGKDKPGAYLFLPTGPSTDYVMTNEQPIIRVIKGPLLNEIHVLFKNIEHRVSLHSLNGEGVNGMGVHIYNLVDVRTGMDNKELSIRIHAPELDSQDVFYTDLNGYQMYRRKYYQKIPIQGNFYPMPSMAYVQDHNMRVSMLGAQPLGVASLQPGSLEIIMDRRLMQDDSRGVSQGVKDNKLTPNKFVLLVEHWKSDDTKIVDETVSYPSIVAHHLSLEMLHPVTSMHLAVQGDAVTYFTDTFLPLPKPLPCDLHILNLRSIREKDSLTPSEESALLLQRLGHECRLDASQYYKATCSKQSWTEVDISLLFHASNIAETSLSLLTSGDVLPLDSSIEIKPMEIKAYKILLQHKEQPRV